MWLTRLAIRRRVTIGMLILGLMVLGLVGYSRMPWDLYPKIDFPYLFVSVPYPGAGPEHCLELTALINIRPGQGNRSMVVQDEQIAATMRDVVAELVGRGGPL